MVLPLAYICVSEHVDALLHDYQSIRLSVRSAFDDAIQDLSDRNGFPKHFSV